VIHPVGSKSASTGEVVIQRIEDFQSGKRASRIVSACKKHASIGQKRRSVAGPCIQQGGAQQGPGTCSGIEDFGGIGDAAASVATGDQHSSVAQQRRGVSRSSGIHGRDCREGSIGIEQISAGGWSRSVGTAGDENSPVLEEYRGRAGTHVSHGVPGLPGSRRNARNGRRQEKHAQQYQNRRGQNLIDDAQVGSPDGTFRQPETAVFRAIATIYLRGANRGDNQATRTLAGGGPNGMGDELVQGTLLMLLS